MAVKQKDSYKRIVIEGTRYYGKHIILSAEDCNENILSTDAIKNFMTTLVERIDMVAYGEPWAERFGEGDEVGISAVQLIMTSAITMHTNDNARDMYLDVFSCKTFDEKDVISVVKDVFNPSNISYHTFFRK